MIKLCPVLYNYLQLNSWIFVTHESDKKNYFSSPWYFSEMVLYLVPAYRSQFSNKLEINDIVSISNEQ